MAWQANLAGAMFGDENCSTWDNTFRLFTWNMQNDETVRTPAEKLTYLKANKSLTTPNVYCMQEVHEDWISSYSDPASFANYYHVDVHPQYSTAVGSDVGFSTIYDVNYNDGCGDSGGFDRRAIIFQLQTNRCLIINVHLTPNDDNDFTIPPGEVGVLTCMFNNLAAIVTAHTGPVIVTGDFNEWDQAVADRPYTDGAGHVAESDEYNQFLIDAGLADEGGYDTVAYASYGVSEGSRVDHIAYKNCTLSNITYKSPETGYSDHGLLYADVTI